MVHCCLFSFSVGISSGGSITKMECIMPKVTPQDLVNAGVHFGHRTRMWNPKMRRYIYGERNGIHIIQSSLHCTGFDQSIAFV